MSAPVVAARPERLAVLDTLHLDGPWPDCACGCGSPCPAYQRNNASKGHRKGAAAPYISGHNGRGRWDPARFTIAESGCFVWEGPPNRKGYGRAQVAGVHHNAHRAVWVWLGLPIADDEHLDHLCGNRLCVNPDHMEPVTAAENARRVRARRAHEDR